jgi:hypothetical protein
VTSWVARRNNKRLTTLKKNWKFHLNTSNLSQPVQMDDEFNYTNNE